MDKSESRSLEQSICQTLLESELDAFIVADGDSKIVFWNAAAETMFGYPREHALGHSVHELIVPESAQERAKDSFRYFRETGSGPLINNVVEIEALHRSGDLFPVELSLSATQIEGAWFSQAIIKSVGRRKEVEAEMLRLATTDALTGVFNRRSMFDHGEREMSRAQRYDHSLSMVLLDIDQLKKINEVSGHYAGDQVIKALADFLKEACRHSDIIGRLSGEEILLLLPETEEKMALMVAEKWRVAVEQLQVRDGDGNIHFSCSIGVIGLTKEERFEDVLKKIEANLEESKNSGGNKVVGGSAD